MKEILTIRLCQYTGEELGNLRKQLKLESYFYKKIPKYTINVITGKGYVN